MLMNDDEILIEVDEMLEVEAMLKVLSMKKGKVKRVVELEKSKSSRRSCGRKQEEMKDSTMTSIGWSRCFEGLQKKGKNRLAS